MALIALFKILVFFLSICRWVLKIGPTFIVYKTLNQICFPEKRFKRCSSDEPFINRTIKTLIRTKLELFKNGKLDEANLLRKSIKREIRKLLRSYYKNKIEELFTNKQKTGIPKLKSYAAGVLTSLISTYQSPLMLPKII